MATDGGRFRRVENGTEKRDRPEKSKKKVKRVPLTPREMLSDFDGTA